MYIEPLKSNNYWGFYLTLEECKLIKANDDGTAEMRFYLTLEECKF